MVGGPNVQTCPCNWLKRYAAGRYLWRVIYFLRCFIFFLLSGEPRKRHLVLRMRADLCTGDSFCFAKHTRPLPFFMRPCPNENQPSRAPNFFAFFWRRFDACEMMLVRCGLWSASQDDSDICNTRAKAKTQQNWAQDNLTRRQLTTNAMLLFVRVGQMKW